MSTAPKRARKRAIRHLVRSFGVSFDEAFKMVGDIPRHRRNEIRRATNFGGQHDRGSH